jgi:hypothetical protein
MTSRSAKNENEMTFRGADPLEQLAYAVADDIERIERRQKIVAIVVALEAMFLLALAAALIWVRR